ncbi:unnamed protein product [Nezara viridula]|uniref:Uncharacterized protein n=1 Tax=Nezara viridula TaxID=85310 RepID=A0A9P0EEF8_NEZVI|nr:unnamed protein product [Nezara viridula]
MTVKMSGSRKNASTRTQIATVWAKFRPTDVAMWE